MARLVFRNGPYSGKSLQIPDGKSITMGRSREIELPLPDLKLSRKHCQITAAPDGFMLRDMGSTNGTYLNGQRVQGEAPLRHFDRLLLGDTEIEFQCPETLDKIETHVGAPDTMAKTESMSPVPNLGGGLKMENASADGFELEPASAGSGNPEIIPAAMESGVRRGFLSPEHGHASAAPAQVSDPVALALLDVDRPLPDEPPELPPRQPQLFFCDGCDGSIPEIEWELGSAREVKGKMLCKDCLAKGGGTSVMGKPRTNTPLPAPVSISQANMPKAAPKQEKPKELDLDDMLKGLDNAEPEIVAEAKPKWMLEKERQQNATPSGVPKPGVPAKPASAAPSSGATGKPPVPVPVPRPATAAPVQPAAPAKPAKSDDDDLVEIG